MTYVHTYLGHNDPNAYVHIKVNFFPFCLPYIYIITAVNVLGDFGLPYVPCTAVKAFCCLWLAIHIVPRVTLWRGWLAIRFGKVFDAIGLPYAK